MSQSERIAKMEHDDDQICRGQQDYDACRQRLMAYRHQTALEDRAAAQRAEAAGEAMQRAGAALQAINPPPTNVTVTCLGCR